MKPMRRTDGLIESPVASIFDTVRSYNGPERLLDLTQGAPSYGPPPEVIEHIRSVTSSEDGSRYTERPGLPWLRRLVAEDINETYGGSITPSNVLITAGCNQAFCVAAAALADTGEEIILPVPYYFNHQMWLQINHIVPQHVMVNDQFVPDVDQVSRRINPKTRAVVLVTPGNPTGRTIPSEILNDFANIAKRNGLVLIIDETYRHFGRVDGRPHELFSRADWQEWAVFLYSFSKEFAIPGYRVGAAVGHPDLVREMMKIMDCVAICAPRVGQEAAIAGLTRCKDWRREKAVEMYGRQSAFEMLLAHHPGHFALASAGALFGWVRHPFVGQSATDIAQRLVTERGIVTLPGTIFSTEGESYLRMSFSGLALTDFGEVGKRLATFGELNSRRIEDENVVHNGQTARDLLSTIKGNGSVVQADLPTPMDATEV